MPPKFAADAFNCPDCGAYSHQTWYDAHLTQGSGSTRRFFGDVHDLALAHCSRCQTYSYWLRGKMIFPLVGSAPLPNTDLPGDVKSDYEEARSIASLSPRGAAALLRLAIQRLCKHLGEKGQDLNVDISNLVKKGLPADMQKSLDIVRVIGNEAVHPGLMDLKDDAETVSKLFGLVNLVAQVMITQPKEIQKIYQGLPEEKRAAIQKRDA